MKILHLQIPIRNTKRNNDLIRINPELLGEFMKLLKSQLNNEFVIVASPCIPSLLSDNDVLYNFDMKEITLSEIKSLIKYP
jgi:hypothetical protein